MWLEVLYHLRHKLGFAFLRLQKSRLVVAILNLGEIICTFIYRGKCDCKIRIISDFKYLSFCAYKNEIDPWQPLCNSVKP